jgi:hypothetical protein
LRFGGVGHTERLAELLVAHSAALLPWDWEPCVAHLRGCRLVALVVVRVLALAHTGHVLIVLWPRGRRVAAGAAGVEQARDCRRQDGLQAGGARLW